MTVCQPVTCIIYLHFPEHDLSLRKQNEHLKKNYEWLTTDLYLISYFILGCSLSLSPPPLSVCLLCICMMWPLLMSNSLCANHFNSSQLLWDPSLRQVRFVPFKPFPFSHCLQYISIHHISTHLLHTVLLLNIFFNICHNVTFEYIQWPSNFIYLLLDLFFAIMFSALFFAYTNTQYERVLKVFHFRFWWMIWRL